MNLSSHKKTLVSLTVVISFGALASVAYATHAWGNYHWARTTNPFTLKLGDNVSSVWDVALATASSDWSASSVLDTVVTASSADPKRCRPTAGRVEVCNSKYGRNGWLGVASVWANGDHLTQGTVKLNDTYFNTATYNTPAWRNLVLCQEVGHTFGLDHQDEVFTNSPLGTCMDYTNDPTPNQHPNQHDYDELEAIYTHLDASTTIAATSATSANNSADEMTTPKEWGKETKRSRDGRTSIYERDLGNGEKVLTFVTWAGEGAVR